MEVSIHLTETGNFWQQSGRTAVRGHAFKDDRLYRASDLLSLVKETPLSEFDRLLESLNGFYSIIHVTDDCIVIATDHIQSYPLFYAITDSEVFVSDDAIWVKSQLSSPKIDPLSEFELLLSRFVTGKDTLYPAIKQVRAGEYVTIDGLGGDPHVKSTRHARFEYREPKRVPKQRLLDELDEILQRVFRRLIELADGRQLAIALSGGPDSRLLACMLTRLGYDNLLAFTYGYPGNWDSKIAVEVADTLDIPIEVVTYDHDTWFEWFHSAERDNYYMHAFNYAAVPSIGAVPAVGKLTRRGTLDSDAIILDGNLATSRYEVPPVFHRSTSFTQDDLIDQILDRYYSNWEWEDEEAEQTFRSKIGSQLHFDGPMDVRQALADYKDWRVRHINARRMVWPQEYDFWGFESWTPLWDREYVSFWESVPVEYRDEKQLHLDYVDRLYGDLTDDDTTFSEDPPKGMLRRVESMVYETPLETIVKPIYDRVETSYKRITRESPYFKDNRALPGIMTEDQFNELCYSYDQDVHPFKALEILGCVTFAPPNAIAVPRAGKIDLEQLQSPSRIAQRDELPWFGDVDSNPIDRTEPMPDRLGRNLAN